MRGRERRTPTMPPSSPIQTRKPRSTDGRHMVPHRARARYGLRLVSQRTSTPERTRSKILARIAPSRYGIGSRSAPTMWSHHPNAPPEPATIPPPRDPASRKRVIRDTLADLAHVSIANRLQRPSPLLRALLIAIPPARLNPPLQTTHRSPYRPLAMRDHRTSTKPPRSQKPNPKATIDSRPPHGPASRKGAIRDYACC